jgi:hypothetical protein
MTEPISFETVTEVWQGMCLSDYADAKRYAEQMSKEQPILQYYLLDLKDLPFNSNEGEIIHYVGLVTWQIMKRSQRRLRKVRIRDLRKAEDANLEFMGVLESDTEADFYSAVQAMIEDYPEPEVLRYIVEAIMEEDEDNPEEIPIRDDYKGLAFVHLKVMLDALIDRRDG